MMAKNSEQGLKENKLLLIMTLSHYFQNELVTQVVTLLGFFSSCRVVMSGHHRPKVYK
jgi:hypothetical protein